MTKFIVLLWCVCAWARDPFTAGGVHVPAGERRDIELPVPAGSDPATIVPITVFHGIHPGPVLAITAGVHGYEYAPIVAAQRLLDRIDPRTLSGTVILARICHVPAFQQRTVYYNPNDGKNLNRVFPGRPDGTQSERIADVITREILRPSDVHIELHGGDGAERLLPWVGIYGGKLAAAQFEKAREVGLAFRFSDVVVYRIDDRSQIDDHRSLNRQAVADEKPTVLVEIGEFGRTDEIFVKPIVDGVLNVLRQLNMTTGSPEPPLPTTRWMDSGPSLSSPATGIWTPAVHAGDQVRKGQLIGRVHDYARKLLAEVVAPDDGIVLHVLVTPPVKAGETLVALARPSISN